MRVVLSVWFIVFAVVLSGTLAGETEFQELVARVESDVLELARRVEDVYQDRCDEVSLQLCANSNHDECRTLYPNQVCPRGVDLAVEACGDGITCSGLVDWTVSNLDLHSSLNRTDPQVIEAVCFTKLLDDYFQLKHNDENERAYWASFGLNTPSIYFGSHTGVFRFYPARHSQECGAFDPRVRPWYIAASSGPKNVVLILDTSQSMSNNGRIDNMKDAAKRIVETLTVGDRVAIVDFSTEARLIALDDTYLFTADKQTKEDLARRIDGMEAGGRTNFLDAFEMAFQVVNASVREEKNVGCNTAFLFLTDGEMTEPEGISEAVVLDLVRNSTAALQERLGYPVFLFTYSISTDDTLPKRLACETGEYGVWSKIAGSDDIIDSLTSYYRLFALGLGSGANEDFRVWVEPYVYASSNIWGTTVSAPVFDQSKDPHLFLGVVGLDLPILAVDQVLEVPGGSDVSLERILRKATALCPNVELDLCELESYRGDDALCTSNCSTDDFVEIEEVACPSLSSHPQEFLANQDVAGLPYEDRACCLVKDDTMATAEEDVLMGWQSCPNEEKEDDNKLSPGAIAGIVVGSVVGIIILVAIFFIFLCRPEREPEVVGIPGAIQ